MQQPDQCSLFNISILIKRHVINSKFSAWLKQSKSLPKAHQLFIYPTLKSWYCIISECDIIEMMILGKGCSRKILCFHFACHNLSFSYISEPSISSKCPFEDAYYFNYNDNAVGYCDNSLSYMKPCVGHEQYQLHFKHCKSHAFMNNMGKWLGIDAHWYILSKYESCVKFDIQSVKQINH